jgi:hypothetical protein
MTEEAVSNTAIPEAARCLGCGYALRGLMSDRCPECARKFDAQDPWTMDCSRPHGAVVGAILSPIGAPTIAVATAATVAIFWWTAALPFARIAMPVGLLTWAAVYLYRIVRFVARRVAAAIYRHPKRSRPRRVFMLLIVLTGLMIWTRFPLRVMFWLHRPAFDRLARHYYEEVPFLNQPAPPKHVGLYPIMSAVATPHGVFVNIDRDLEVCYLPDADLPYPARRWHYLGGEWYFDGGYESDLLVRPVDYVEYKIWRMFRR